MLTGLVVLTKVTTLRAMGMFPIWDIPLQWESETQGSPDSWSASAELFSQQAKIARCQPVVRGCGSSFCVELSCLPREIAQLSEIS